MKKGSRNRHLALVGRVTNTSSTAVKPRKETVAVKLPDKLVATQPGNTRAIVVVSTNGERVRGRGMGQLYAMFYSDVPRRQISMVDGSGEFLRSVAILCKTKTAP